MNHNQSSIQFSSAKYLGIEKNQPFPNQIEITVTRSGNLDNFNTVEVHLGNRTAQEGFDFSGIFPQWIDFEPGQTEQKIYIDINDDYELEGTEEIELKLITNPGDPSLILGDQNTTTVSILDNETTYLEFESAKYVTFEQDDPYFNQLEVTITRSGNIDTYTTAYFDIIEGNADFSDFYLPNFMVDFDYGQTSQTLYIEVPNDWTLEGTETFQLQLVDDPYNPAIELGENATTTVEILDKQTTYLEFESAKYVTFEQDDPYFNQLEVTITRSGNIDTYTTAYFDIIEGSADFSDFYLPNFMVDFDYGQTSQTLYIEVPNDWTLEGTETFQLQLVDDPYNPAIELGENATTTVEILDKQTTYLEFESAKYVTFEQDDPYFNQLEVTITRSGNIDTYTTAYFDIIEGSADFSDFYLPNFMVDFDYGQTSQTLYIEVPNDWTLEGTETFQLQLVDDPYNPAIELGENATTTVEILDKQTTYLEFESAKYVTFEQDDPYFNQLEVTITRSGNIDTYTTAYFDIIEGSADFSDFYLPNFMVDFDYGQTSQTLYIEVPNDWTLEGTETFQLQLVDDPYNPAIELGENATTTVEILDKQTTYLEFESAKYVTFEQDDPYFNQLEVTITRSGNIDTYTTAYFDIIEGSADFSDFYLPNFMVDFDYGQTSQTLYIEVPNDWTLEGTETFQLQLVDDPYNPAIELGENATTTVEILDKQTTYLEFESAKYVTFEQDDPYFNQLEVTITRSGNIDTYTTAYFDIIEGSADFSDFYLPNFMVDFDYGQTSQTLYIEVPNDWTLEGTETFQLQLVDDPYNPAIELGENATTTVEILDNSPTVEFGSVSYTLNEDQGYTMVVEVIRSGDLSFESIVNLNVLGGTATAGDDYDYLYGKIYFNYGQTRQFVEIGLNNDSLIEGIETLELEIIAADEPYDNYVIGTQNTTTVEIIDNDAIIAEIGEVTNLNHESQTIFLDHNFINPVIFAQPLSRNGADPSTIRITDIQSNSFSVQLQETTLINGNSHSGHHTTETFSFLVIEQGIWELSDGSILEVGNVTTDRTTTSSWETINFNHNFTNTPVILTQVQTDNDATFVRTRQNNATNNGFEVALEEEEAFKNSGHGSETIAWLAISSGQGNWDGNGFIAGNTGNQVTHNWHTIDFGNNFINAPKFLGNIATYDGPDSSGLRYQNLTNGNVQIMVEEDTSNDSETNHTTEDINFFAIEGSGNLTGSFDSLTGLVDTKTGTINGDVFVLGNEVESFYDNYGQQDYTEISDFDLDQDIIQLHGLADDYYIASSPSGTNDQGIFLKVAGMEDELVGIVKNTNTLNINSNNFAFV
ncbi:hypothetical protein cce_0239 [Crocosphaera subtropica ATCC 51142]|uniref:Calx-beta domain-containing protein n=1 Tax=Crocosphaera subtropica (strain ATCC 51142 / BH68) TaxID=43989 RepID=B1X089_CROS5|nr:Calx-beta domain-containing protein [Crocosphaera subtropica]ACB49590.1 hypothetical protein cce_0239 [Crocosphaera subtropica ATCC 51142]